MKATIKQGLSLLDFIELSKPEQLKNYSPIRGSLVVAINKNRVLVVYNKYRKQWELPGGKLEKDETSEECARREFHEETF